MERRIREALEKMECADIELPIEIPPDAAMGDLAVPCFLLSKNLRKPPQKIAEELAAAVRKGEPVERIEVKGPYVNFFIDLEKLKADVLKEALDKREKYGSLEKKNIRILVEHTSANPTGPLHVGRARNPLIGDSIVRILRMAGYDVTSEFYVNDVGKQVVTLAYGVQNLQPEGEADRERDDYRLVLNYQAASRLMEEDPSVLDEINGMLYDLEHGDEKTIMIVRESCEKILNAIIGSLREINITIDQFTWESKFIQERKVAEIIDRLKKSPMCKQEEDGAYALDLGSYGIHGKETDFIFTRKDGTSLYTSRDLAYHLDKFGRCDIAIDVLGEDQKLGQMQLSAALDIIGEKRRAEYIFYAFVSLPEGRMSTRKGTVVYLDDLLDEALSRAMTEVKKRREDLSEERMRRIAKVVSVGAVRYNIVRIQAEKQIVFKWEDALNFEGNSAPFVQYSHARACSILKKGLEEGTDWKDYDPAKLVKKQELDLVKAIASLPMIVDDCAESRKAHPMAQYALELATLFNQFYQFVPVLRADEAERKARLALVEAARWALGNSLSSLGIEAPDEM
ncbi:MAG: arginine--tRNA ligase [Thermoplasmata archaeon]|nr:arginine--tRNA ligase [Thermoplasmata archaeon]